MKYQNDLNGYYTFSTKSNTLELSSTLSTSADMQRQPKIAMRTVNRSSYTSGMERDANGISTATPTFSTMPDSFEVLPTLSDVGRQPEIAMAAYKQEVVITQERREI